MFVIGYHQNESSQLHTQNLTIERQNSYGNPPGALNSPYSKCLEKSRQTPEERARLSSHGPKNRRKRGVRRPRPEGGRFLCMPFGHGGRRADRVMAEAPLMRRTTATEGPEHK